MQLHVHETGLLRTAVITQQMTSNPIRPTAALMHALKEKLEAHMMPDNA